MHSVARSLKLFLRHNSHAHTNLSQFTESVAKYKAMADKRGKESKGKRSAKGKAKDQAKKVSQGGR